jgi:type I protein arginine methyltransferase
MTPPRQESTDVLGQYIPLHYHFHMLGDRARMKSFKEALAAVVPEGGKVVDLGGGTGVLSFFAAQKASKVWCVERNADLVESARNFLRQNPLGDRVEVVQADALEFLPPEPVDVVICEMLHVGLLREKQTEVIASFKQRYTEKFGKKLPLFVPEASILAVQPVHQNFHFSGYFAPVPMFFDPLVFHDDETKGLGDPKNYQMVVYSEEFSQKYQCEAVIPITHGGTLNALRLITKNVLAILVKENRTIDWFNQYLVIPLPNPMEVKAGDQVSVNFRYDAGESLKAVMSSVQVSKGGAPVSV